MHFQVSRNGQLYGPYTLQDLSRYVASGNVLPSDLAKSEEMTEWRPVSELLASHAAGVAPAAAPGGLPPADYNQPYLAQPYGQPNAPAAAAFDPNRCPDAPGLSWGWYLALTILTCALFSKVFILVQAAWLKRVQPNSRGLLMLGAQTLVLLLAVGINLATFKMPVPGTVPQQNPIVSLLSFVYLVLLFTGRFVMRSSLEEHYNTVEPLGLKLDAVMTFFFGGIYFQSQLNKMNALKQAMRGGAAAPYGR